MLIEIFKFENRTSDGENFLPIGRDDSPVYFVLYDQTHKDFARLSLTLGSVHILKLAAAQLVIKE